MFSEGYKHKFPVIVRSRLLFNSAMTAYGIITFAQLIFIILDKLIDINISIIYISYI